MIPVPPWRLPLCQAAMLWFAVGCTETGVTPGEGAARADSADQIMVRMSTRLTEQGVLRSFVEADTAYLYQARQVTDLRGLRIRFLDAQGTQKSTLTARRGIYNSASGKLDARGEVVVETADGRRLKTEHLIYDRLSNRVQSDSAFTYESGTEIGGGKSFTSDIDFRNLEIIGPKGFQKGKGILLPRPGQ